jgi:hypothetical protein
MPPAPVSRAIFQMSTPQPILCTSFSRLRVTLLWTLLPFSVPTAPATSSVLTQPRLAPHKIPRMFASTSLARFESLLIISAALVYGMSSTTPTPLPAPLPLTQPPASQSLSSHLTLVSLPTQLLARSSLVSSVTLASGQASSLMPSAAWLSSATTHRAWPTAQVISHLPPRPSVPSRPLASWSVPCKFVVARRFLALLFEKSF